MSPSWSVMRLSLGSPCELPHTGLGGGCGRLCPRSIFHAAAMTGTSQCPRHSRRMRWLTLETSRLGLFLHFVFGSLLRGRSLGHVLRNHRVRLRTWSRSAGLTVVPAV